MGNSVEMFNYNSWNCRQGNLKLVSKTKWYGKGFLVLNGTVEWEMFWEFP